MSKTSHLPRYYLRRYLAAGYALFIVYVSLSPFSGWQNQNLSFMDVLAASPLQTFTSFDFILNMLSYLPMGFLLALIMRERWSNIAMIPAATLAGLLLALLMEYTQLYLPSRVSSNSDLISDTLGAFCGASLAFGITRYVWLAQLRNSHNKWFKHGHMSDIGLALLVLWMFGQINPSQPMLGSVFVSEIARWKFDIVPAAPFSWQESAIVTLNLLLLGILLPTILRERRYAMNTLLVILLVITLLKFLAAAVLLKSWALLIWMDSEAILGIVMAIIMLSAAWRLSPKRMIACGAVAACLYLALLLNLLLGASPATAHRLYHWHYLHMLNYNGLSQLALLLFPLLLLLYMWRTAKLQK